MSVFSLSINTKLRNYRVSEKLRTICLLLYSVSRNSNSKTNATIMCEIDIIISTQYRIIT
ncbi:hypothetical protein C0T31_01080 [Dysgonamonadaceae bacterium]|nr:hypothetical protein C0T31_01080 [Dysgonamonadaceae bacterium]